MTDSDDARKLRAHARQMDDVLSDGLAKLRAIRETMEARSGTGTTEYARVPAIPLPVPARVIVPPGILYGVGVIWEGTPADAQECVFAVRRVDGRCVIEMPLAALVNHKGPFELLPPYQRAEGEFLYAEVWPVRGHVVGSVCFQFELERLKESR